jgi:acetyl esterase/lipase
MKKIVYFLTLLIANNLVHGQTLVSAVQLASKTTSQIGAVIGYSGAPYNAVKIYKISYNTKDPFNNTTVATGAVFIPTLICDSLPLVGYCHGTVLKKTEVPSKQYDNNYEGLYFSAKGYVVAMPDYLGLGDNAGFHPYLHSETEARATIDLMRAAREYIADSTTLGLNGQVFISGYSQGGHAAMATLKYIQDSSLLSEFNVIAGAPMSGPYSLSTVQPHTVYDSTYNYNAFTPYVVNSYQYVYGNLYTTVNQYYDSPYDVNIPPYLNGNYTFTTLNSLLPGNVYHFMNDSVLDAFIADSINFTTPLRHDLKLNDNYAWNASMPLRLCYCGSDDLVLPGNSLVAADSMTARGSADVTAININTAGDHFTCFNPAISYVRTWFDTFKITCSITSGIDEEIMNTSNIVTVFPNPASNVIGIQSTLPIKEVELTDINGRAVFTATSLNKKAFQINVGNINNGFYIIKSLDQQGGISFKKIMIQKSN